MQIYDPQKPLIFCHIPKTAGISVRAVFETWFGANLLPHYAAGGLPPQYDLTQPPIAGAPVAVYGHFNSARGFGVQDYYPQVEQCIAIFRDPWETAISLYFYVLSAGPSNRFFEEFSTLSLEQYLENRSVPDGAFGSHFAPYFPKPCTLDTYQEVLDTSFLELGLTEQLEESLRRIAKALDKPFEASALQHLNKAERAQDIPVRLKQAFIEHNPLDYAIYNSVKTRFE